MKSRFIPIILVFALLLQWTGGTAVAEWVWCFEDNGHVHLEQPHKNIQRTFLLPKATETKTDQHHFDDVPNECLDVPFALSITTSKTPRPEHEASQLINDLESLQISYVRRFLTIDLLAEPPPQYLPNTSLSSLRTIILTI